jgi:hypothetical protein
MNWKLRFDAMLFAEYETTIEKLIFRDPPVRKIFRMSFTLVNFDSHCIARMTKSMRHVVIGAQLTVLHGILPRPVSAVKNSWHYH